MRVEPHNINSIVHVIKRGARGMDITKNIKDKRRFMQSLFLLNDEYVDSHWVKATLKLPPFQRPEYWPDRKPIVRILAWTLLSNHFHILMQETKEGGIAKFMQRVCGSMSVAFNNKYKEKGSLFQGSYKGKTIKDESHFLYLPFYILVKNTFEMYPGGLIAAAKNFDKAWQWAMDYEFSSFGAMVKKEECPILDDPEKIISKFFENEKSFKKEAKELLYFHMNTKGKDFKDIMLENW
jgi:putative transposase